MTFILFILILSILILVHEAGHFLMAKKLGVKVDEFSLGFGKKLYSRVINGTEYRLCAIPLGGYVKMAGDERSQCKGKSDEYYSKPLGHRSLIILMGPIVNYLLAYVCFSLVFMVGYIDLEATQKAVPAVVGRVQPSSPAEKAGFQAGDKIVGINNITISNWSDMQEIIASAGTAELHVLAVRKQTGYVLDVTPQVHKVKDLFGRERNVSRIGIEAEKLASADKLVVKRYKPIEALGKGGAELAEITVKTYAALWEIVTGQRSAKEGMTGLIGIFFIIKFAAAIGFSFLLHVIGVISASLAIFNLLPVIPLDGGHLFLIGLEKVRGRALSPKADDIIAKAGLALIIALAVFVFYVDFERIGLFDKFTHFFK
jgi:regulator of sigma E protease